MEKRKRGRPKLPQGERLTTIAARFCDEDRALLMELAHEMQTTPSAVLRAIIREQRMELGKQQILRCLIEHAKQAQRPAEG